jgi:hypothetical protein
MGRTAHIDLFATPSGRDIEIAEEMLDLLGIVHLSDQPYTEISGGERQITLVARALAQEPKILVMDEPTASLDFGNQVRVLSEIKALAGRGIAVILSTHDPDQAFLCAHRVAILHKGRLAHLGPPQEVITSENLRAIYGVDVEVWPIERGRGEQLRVCVRHSPNPLPGLRLSNEILSIVLPVVDDLQAYAWSERDLTVKLSCMPRGKIDMIGANKARTKEDCYEANFPISRSRLCVTRQRAGPSAVLSRQNIENHRWLRRG